MNSFSFQSFYLLIILLGLMATSNSFAAIKKICAKNADIIFVLDASSSIWGPDFTKQLNFVKSVINEFNIYSDGSGTRVGVLTFSNPEKVKIQFNLNTHFNRSKLMSAIDSIGQSLGNTYTNVALSRVRGQMLRKEAGLRVDDPSVIKMVIVMTDGVSEYPPRTALEAKLIQNTGVRVLSIGIGNVNMQEINALASEPKENNTFIVDTFKGLSAIKEILAVRACDIKTPIPPPVCEVVQKSDVAFVLGDMITSNTKKLNGAITLIKNISSEFEIGPEKMLVSLVPKDCTAPGFDFKDYKSNEEVNQHLDNVEMPDKTASRISNLAAKTFTADTGARRGVRKVAIVMVEGPLNNKMEIFKAARQAKSNGIRLVAIGVGPNVNLRELRYISGTRKLAFHIDSYQDFDNELQRSKALYSFVCKGDEFPESTKQPSGSLIG